MFLFLQTLIFLTSASQFVFPDITIAFATLQSTSVIDFVNSSNVCGKMIARDNQLYHVSTKNMVQSALKTSL